MLLSSFLALLGAVAVNAAACNQNNCYRAVSNAKNGVADCTSYLSDLPPAVTATSTTTITTTTTVVRRAKRDADPDTAALLQARATTNTVPAYASACPSPEAYTSACSCLGYSPTVTIAPTTVSTTTVTTRTTSTVVSICPAPSSVCYRTSCFDLTSDPNNCGTCGNVCSSSQPYCCRGKCVDYQSDPFNCGSCGRMCQFARSGQACFGGGCVCSQQDPNCQH